MLNLIVKGIIWILNLLFYLVIINFLLLPGIIGCLNYWGVAVALALNVFFILFIGGKLYRPIFQTPAEPGKPGEIFVGRFYTGRKYFLFGLALDIVVFCLLWAFIGDVSGSALGWGLVCALPLGGLVWGIFKPESRAPKGSSALLNMGIICALFLFVVISWGLSLLSRQVNYSTKSYAPWSYFAFSSHFIERMMPPEATDITITGYSRSPYWRCSVGEKDFLNFAARNNYPLKENDPYYNANPETNKDRVRALGIFSDMNEPPESYYIYNYRYRNCGGWLLLYDRDKQVLHGSYSRN